LNENVANPKIWAWHISRHVKCKMYKWWTYNAKEFKSH